jgi:hypothetical protein
MTRLAELYKSKDFGGARLYCEIAFRRYLRIFKPTGIFTEDHLKIRLLERIVDKYFYDIGVCNGEDTSNPKVCVLSLFGFNKPEDASSCEDWETYNDALTVDDVIEKYWAILLPQKPFDGGAFYFRYEEFFGSGVYRSTAMINGKDVYVKKSQVSAFKKLAKELDKINPVLKGGYWGNKYRD